MVLVTGGTGVVGRKLIQKLHGTGRSIRLFCLPADPGIIAVQRLVADIRTGTIADAQDVNGLCEGVDTVYHLASVILSADESLFTRVNELGTQYLVRDALRHRVAHFIYVSSASVAYPKPTPYSLSKKKCEESVMRSGLHYTIVRPTLVYDTGRGGQEFDLFLDYLRKYPVVPFIGRGRALKRPVFVDDAIQGLFLLYGRNDVYGRIYNLSGAEAITMIDFSRLCLRLLGMPDKPVVPVPVWLCILAAKIMRTLFKDPPLKWQTVAGIIQDANLDPSAAVRDLGYNPAGVSTQLPECFPRE